MLYVYYNILYVFYMYIISFISFEYVVSNRMREHLDLHVRFYHIELLYLETFLQSINIDIVTNLHKLNKNSLTDS